MSDLADLMPVAAEAAAAGLAAVPASVPVERAQAVRCGARSLALPHGWARAALDDVELSAVPGAPAWLAGAINVEGLIVPVIDLLAWLEPGRFIDPSGRDVRVLVGGVGEDSAALLFEGIPRLVRLRRHAATAADDKLGAFAIGSAEDDPATIALDMPSLVEALIAELALH